MASRGKVMCPRSHRCGQDSGSFKVPGLSWGLTRVASEKASPGSWPILLLRAQAAARVVWDDLLLFTSQLGNVFDLFTELVS